MKPSTKFVSDLTDQQQERLEQLRRECDSFRVRQRAFAILLSHRGYCVNELAEFFGAHRDTVAGWIDAWEAEGEDGLYDKPRSGAPPTLTPQEQDRAVELLRKYPHQPQKVLALLEQETGKTICRRTLSRLARSRNLSWKRTRRSSKPHRDEAEFRRAQEEVDELRREHEQGQYDVFFFDESGFSCQPSVSYAWHDVGQTLETPSKRSTRLNVLGFFSPSHDFFARTQEKSVNSEDVVSAFDEFASNLEQETIVVVDQASTHTSAKFKAALPCWEEQGLYVYFLPTYSPELNLIEIVWRMIKYHWLPLWAYKDFTSLKQAVLSVLQHIGDEFQIELSEPVEPQSV